MKSFHDTIKENNPVNENKARSQEDKVLKLFNKFPNKKYTAFELWRIVFKETVPITSVRRSLSNLMNLGKLIKTEEKRKGRYGKVNYCYKLNA